jgi:HAE1 family hydrophobic/amphiphilic exporter-1
MFLSDFSIRRPVATVVLIIALMAFGVLALTKLRVNEIPDVQQPVEVISIDYPGASPETVEREIINRIEKSLQSISGVYEIRSTARDGNAQIVIVFDFKKNMIEASDQIRNAIAAVRYKLPVEMREPILERVDPSDQPIMNLALSSTSCAAWMASPPSKWAARSSASCRCCSRPTACAPTTSRWRRSWPPCGARTPMRRSGASSAR